MRPETSTRSRRFTPLSNTPRMRCEPLKPSPWTCTRTTCSPGDTFSLTQSLNVSPGEHVVRVQVQGDGFSGSQRIRGVFESGVKRRPRVGGLGLLSGGRAPYG